MNKNFQKSIPTRILNFCKKVYENGGEAWIVGGWIRDHFLDIQSTSDVDIEIFHLTYDEVRIVCKDFCLAEFPKFGVFKCEGMDISLPRIETCIGKHYNSFKTILLPHLSYRKAALRRDFTINSLYWNPLTCELMDPFWGRKDIQLKYLRPISERFKEDAYRVLRAAQFIARFGLSPTKTLVDYIRMMKKPILSKNHIKYTLDCLNKAPNREAAWSFLEQIHWAKFLI